MRRHFLTSYSLTLALLTPACSLADSAWQWDASASDEAHSDRLPVLLLGQNNWSNHYQPDGQRSAHAWRALRLEVNATHVSGWGIGFLARSEAALTASADTIDAATISIQKNDPAAPRSFQVRSLQKSWSGRGLSVRTPAWPLGLSGWTAAGSAQILALQRLNVSALQGQVDYAGGGVYNAILGSDHYSPRIEGPFLGPSAPMGWAASVSVVLHKPWDGQRRYYFVADDLASVLRWRLARDTAVLNSQVKTRAADGTLDYGPLTTGQQSLTGFSQRMDTDWQAGIAWADKAIRGSDGRWTLDARRRSGLNQAWAGWESARFQPRQLQRTPSSAGWGWRAAVAPVMRAVSLDVQYGGWFAAAATDKAAEDARYRRLQLGWRGSFD